MESSVSPAREQAEWHMLCWRLILSSYTQPVGRQESPEEKLGSMLLGHFCSTAFVEFFVEFCELSDSQCPH